MTEFLTVVSELTHYLGLFYMYYYSKSVVNVVNMRIWCRDKVSCYDVLPRVRSRSTARGIFPLSLTTPLWSTFLPFSTFALASNPTKINNTKNVLKRIA